MSYRSARGVRAATHRRQQFATGAAVRSTAVRQRRLCASLVAHCHGVCCLDSWCMATLRWCSSMSRGCRHPGSGRPAPSPRSRRGDRTADPGGHGRVRRCRRRSASPRRRRQLAPAAEPSATPVPADYVRVVNTNGLGVFLRERARPAEPAHRASRGGRAPSCGLVGPEQTVQAQVWRLCEQEGRMSRAGSPAVSSGCTVTPTPVALNQPTARPDRVHIRGRTCNRLCAHGDSPGRPGRRTPSPTRGRRQDMPEQWEREIDELLRRREAKLKREPVSRRVRAS